MIQALEMKTVLELMEPGLSFQQPAEQQPRTWLGPSARWTLNTRFANVQFHIEFKLKKSFCRRS